MSIKDTLRVGKYITDYPAEGYIYDTVRCRFAYVGSVKNAIIEIILTGNDSIYKWKPAKEITL